MQLHRVGLQIRLHTNLLPLGVMRLHFVALPEQPVQPEGRSISQQLRQAWTEAEQRTVDIKYSCKADFVVRLRCGGCTEDSSCCVLGPTSSS
jgi:hypothetical protein